MFEKAVGIGENINDKLIHLIYYDYAMFLEDLKQINQSKLYIRKSIEYCSKSKNEKNEKNITQYIHISSCYVQLKEYDSVRKWLQSAEKLILIESDQNNNGFMDEYNLNCALCYLLSDKDYENALKYYEKMWFICNCIMYLQINIKI